MKKIAFLFFSALLVVSCATTKQQTNNDILLDYGSPNVKQELLNDLAFKITIHSDDATYGFTKENPVMVGGGAKEGPINQRRFLYALAGPNGEAIIYYRMGSCCPFHTKNGNSESNTGFLDMYNVT